MDSLSEADRPETFQGVIHLDEGQVRSHVDQVVRESVEQTLNGLLEAEADQLCQAGRYERSPASTPAPGTTAGRCTPRPAR